MADTPNDGTPALQEFPLYYPSAPANFILGGQPSGAVGAIARANIGLTNLPHILFGIRVDNLYDLDDLTLKAQIAAAGLDTEQTLEVQIAQQNITAGPTLQRHVCGTPQTGQVWHPLPSPFGFTGTNNVTIILRRVISYPAEVIPVAWVTLITCQMNATNFAGTTPSGHVGGRR